MQSATRQKLLQINMQILEGQLMVQLFSTFRSFAPKSKPISRLVVWRIILLSWLIRTLEHPKRHGKVGYKCCQRTWIVREIHQRTSYKRFDIQKHPPQHHIQVRSLRVQSSRCSAVEQTSSRRESVAKVHHYHPAIFRAFWRVAHSIHPVRLGHLWWMAFSFGFVNPRILERFGRTHEHATSGLWMDLVLCTFRPFAWPRDTVEEPRSYFLPKQRRSKRFACAYWIIREKETIYKGLQGELFRSDRCWVLAWIR